jgi:hypothetical protein
MTSLTGTWKTENGHNQTNALDDIEAKKTAETPRE